MLFPAERLCTLCTPRESLEDCLVLFRIALQPIKLFHNNLSHSYNVLGAVSSSMWRSMIIMATSSTRKVLSQEADEKIVPSRWLCRISGRYWPTGINLVLNGDVAVEIAQGLTLLLASRVCLGMGVDSLRVRHDDQGRTMPRYDRSRSAAYGSFLCHGQVLDRANVANGELVHNSPPKGGGL